MTTTLKPFTMLSSRVRCAEPPYKKALREGRLPDVKLIQTSKTRSKQKRNSKLAAKPPTPQRSTAVTAEEAKAWRRQTTELRASMTKLAKDLAAISAAAERRQQRKAKLPFAEAMQVRSSKHKRLTASPKRGMASKMRLSKAGFNAFKNRRRAK